MMVTHSMLEVETIKTERPSGAHARLIWQSPVARAMSLVTRIERCRRQQTALRRHIQQVGRVAIAHCSLQCAAPAAMHLAATTARMRILNACTLAAAAAAGVLRVTDHVTRAAAAREPSGTPMGA
jgi:hypothetical protein